MERPSWWYETDVDMDCADCSQRDNKIEDIAENMHDLLKIIYKDKVFNFKDLEWVLEEMCSKLNVKYEDYGVQYVEVIKQRGEFYE